MPGGRGCPPIFSSPPRLGETEGAEKSPKLPSVKTLRGKIMDKDRGKITAAIMAAVNAYMEEEEMARAMMAMPQRRPVPAISLWHVSGREEMMRMRQLWQRRIN